MSPRRLATAVTLLLAVALAPFVGPGPAQAEPSEASPGVPRADAAMIASGSYFSCAIVSDGTVRCWGSSADGELGQGNVTNVGDNPGESTVAVPLGRPAVAVTAGASHACAILDTGQLRCWGRNDYGQLGQGHHNDIGDTPGESTVAVDLGPGRTAIAVSAGGHHTCAILDTGQLRCWGRNVFGQLGQGNTISIGEDPGESTVPVTLPRPAVAVTASYSSTCAILDTGELRCWGRNNAGQLMQGNTIDIGDSPGESTAHVDTSGHHVLAVTGSDGHFCAIYDDHTVHCWGPSDDGELGLGRTSAFGDEAGETSVGRTDLPPGRTAISVAGGGYSSCAILDTGQLHCWGWNAFGQLGQGHTSNIGDNPGEYTVPVDVGGTVRAISLGYGSICAVTDTGLRCWGLSDSGQLGQGSGVSFGKSPGEVPRLLPPINLGGQQVGRDTDGDGVRDAVDACPAVPGTLLNGCADPVGAPEAVLKGKKVVLDTLLTKTKASATCPKMAKVTVKTKTSGGRITVVKQLKAKADNAGCRIKGTVRLPAKPKKTAKVKLTVSGKKMKTRHLIAVRL